MSRYTVTLAFDERVLIPTKESCEVVWVSAMEVGKEDTKQDGVLQRAKGAKQRGGEENEEVKVEKVLHTDFAVSSLKERVAGAGVASD